MEQQPLYTQLRSSEHLPSSRDQCECALEVCSGRKFGMTKGAEKLSHTPCLLGRDHQMGQSRQAQMECHLELGHLLDEIELSNLYKRIQNINYIKF